MTPAQLRTAVETLGGAILTPTETGGWKAFAEAAESFTGSTPATTNKTVFGYMLRATLAFETQSGPSSANENMTEDGLLLRIVNALERITGVTEGSLILRFLTALLALIEGTEVWNDTLIWDDTTTWSDT